MVYICALSSLSPRVAQTDFTVYLVGGRADWWEDQAQEGGGTSPFNVRWILTPVLPSSMLLGFALAILLMQIRVAA